MTVRRHLPIGDRLADIVEPSPALRSSSQSGMKLYNERLILSLVRTHGTLSRVELARRTGLSAQSCSAIIKQLEQEGLLLRGAPLRAGVGQPSIPMRLAGDGAYSIGIKIGRRSTDVLLMDFVGASRNILRYPYANPLPEDIEAFLAQALKDVVRCLSPPARKRICGVGVAVPAELWSWGNEVGISSASMELWKRYDLVGSLQQIVKLPLNFGNDAAAACAAELMFGNPGQYTDYLYIFVGTLIGSGLVLNGSLYTGKAGYAGSLGSMPVSVDRSDGSGRRLIQCASLSLLERALRANGIDPVILLQPQDWTPIEAYVAAWIATSAEAIAFAIEGAVAVIDFEAVIVDGAMPASVRHRLTTQVKAHLDAQSREGVALFEITEGTVGADARVIGAASLPLLSRFNADRQLLFGAANTGARTQ